MCLVDKLMDGVRAIWHSSLKEERCGASPFFYSTIDKLSIKMTPPPERTMSTDLQIYPSGLRALS